MIGRVFGKLKVIESAHGKRRKYWKCVCECGEDILASERGLVLGVTLSCKHCARYSRLGGRVSNHHNPVLTTLKGIWTGIKLRCAKPPCLEKGITMAKEWAEDFDAFHKYWIDAGWDSGKKVRIKRIDNSKGFFPENCLLVKGVGGLGSTENSDKNYCGVTRYGPNGNRGWRAHVSVKRKFVHIGVFRTQIEAVEARNRYVVNNGLQEYCEIHKI